MDASHYYRYIDLLVERTKAGDAAALGELRQIYSPLISASIRRCVVKIPESAPSRDDLEADAIFILRDLVGTYEPELSYFSYFLSTRLDYAVVAHCRKTYLKGANDVSIDSLSYDIVDNAQTDPFAKVLENDAVNKALQRLVPKQREAVELYFFDNLTQEQAAQQLKITQASFCKRLQRALSTLKVILSESSKE